MKKATVPVLFVIAIAILAGIFFVTTNFVSSPQEPSGTRAKIISPKASGVEDSPDLQASSGYDSAAGQVFDTFVELSSGETLISSMTLDLNDDGFDDEVIVVRNASTPYFVIIPALYNPTTAVYDRISEIDTKISRVRTFSYMGMDIVGDHHNALIYQGSDDDGSFVLQIFRFRQSGQGAGFVKIGDFVSDGTIFIQQTERSDSYALSLSRGEPFSVWVYKSDRNSLAADGTANQLQQEYKWNSVSGRYELANEIKVTASHLAGRELSRIQDGTVETFAAFLNGLWYKTSNEDAEIRYIYFNYDTKEVIQLHGDIQEVFDWEDSKLRHNGIYLTTLNSSISTLQRRFDIVLSSVDEIRLTLRDYINLDITESTLWDGQYKKLSIQSTFDTADPSQEKGQVISELEKSDSWTSADTLSSIGFKASVYVYKTDAQEEKGIYSTMKIGAYEVLELRPDSGASLLNKTYSMEFGSKVIEETVRRQTVERIVPDYDTVIFVPVKITPTDCFAADGKTFTFTRE